MKSLAREAERLGAQPIVIPVATSEEVIKPGQAFARNPSPTGTKSEEGILVDATGFRVLTKVPDWPTIDIFLSGAKGPIAHPAILCVV